MPIWLIFLFSWGVFAILLFAAEKLQWLTFHSEIVFHIFCAPVVIPIYSIGFPIALLIRAYREIKYKIEKQKLKRKK